VCLLNEDFAKKYLAVMARELEVCPDAVVRNNVMLVLCDLCMRYAMHTRTGRKLDAWLSVSRTARFLLGGMPSYAAMMDKYIPTLAGCLHDKSELVRRQALTMLTRMLQVRLPAWGAQCARSLVNRHSCPLSLERPSARAGGLRQVEGAAVLPLCHRRGGRLGGGARVWYAGTTRPNKENRRVR